MMDGRFVRILAAVAIGLACLLPAPAVEPVVEMDPMEVTGTLFAEPLDLAIDSPAAPIRIPELSGLAVRDPAGMTLRRAMRDSPGVVSATGNGLHDFFVIRGVDSLSGSLVMLDGIPAREATFYPLHHIRSVRVLKGPGSFAYGGNALAGAVNLVRSQPGPEVHPSITFGYGSHDAYRVNGTWGVWDERPDVGIRIDALYREADSHRDLVEGELSAVNLGAVWFPGERDTVRLFVDLQESDVTPDAGVPVVGDRLFSESTSVTFQDPSDFSEQSIARVVFSWERELSESLRIRDRAYVTDFEWITEGVVYAGFVLAGQGLEPAPRTLSRYRPELDEQQRLLGNEVELRWNGEAAGMEHHALVGIEAQRFTDDFTLLIPPTTDIDTVTGQETPGFLAPLPTNTGDATIDQFSVYAMDRVDVAPSWSVLLGGRGDWLDFDDDDRGTSRSDQEFSPFAGLGHAAAEWLSLYVNAGRGFGQPSTLVVGPRGEPETSEQIEAGMVVRCPRVQWEAAVAWFGFERANVAVPDATGVTRATGEQSSEGVEVDVRGPLVEGVSLRLVYGYLDSTLDRFTELGALGLADRSGNTAPFSPEHVGEAWLAWEPTDRWDLGVGVRSVSEQFIAADNVFAIDETTTMDARIGYETDHWTAFLDLRNLTGEEGLGRGQGSVSVIPEDDFSIYGVVSVRM